MDLELIYNAIKSDIRNHKVVSSSILGLVPEWKRSQFVILAEIIAEHLSDSESLTKERKLNLGRTISAITLQRFFENDYQTKTHNDLRFIKTLDKLCIFLGKFDLNTYIRDRVHETSETEVITEFKVNSLEEDLILKYCKAHFDAYTELPEIKINNISNFVFKDSPFHERIRLDMETKIKKKLLFLTENNRSNYEIFEIKKISDDAELKVIKTQEFWNLVFVDDKENNYIINHLNTQFYFLKKVDQEWKIWDNYNPDHGKFLKTN